MLKSSEASTALIPAGRGAPLPLKAGGKMQLRLKIAAGVLAVLNGVGLFLYFFPPGGSRAELTQQIAQLHSLIAAARVQTGRLATTAGKVEAGSKESGSFEAKYFLPKREAYLEVVEEIQRMAKASNLQERDGVWSDEPIEGTADLSLLNMAANYAGSYASLMQFVNEVDHSPMLLMLDALQASPQQKSGQINASIRFQAIVREPAGARQ
jgi:Tfp pilus assembly protein PilO